MSRKVRIGIIGAGLMGRELAAAIRRWPALIDHPITPEITAVCDIIPHTMEWFDQLGTVNFRTTDYTELIAREDVDVVYIAVRHDLHEEIYVNTFEAGKDVLAEKPFGIDLDAALRILRAAKTAGVFVRCSSEMPFFPGAQMAIDHIRSGALGQIIEVRSAFLHASDTDRNKQINWKRQAQYCGDAGVMNDLGLHALHVPLRLGWEMDRLFAQLQNIVNTRPSPSGELVACDTWDNATLHIDAHDGQSEFPLSVEMKRISPGNKNTWLLEAVGMDGGIRFSTKYPSTVDVFSEVQIGGYPPEQAWSEIDAGSQSVWPTVTGGIFEFGFSDSILQMWAAYLAERAGVLGGRFGCATAEEALRTHELYSAAMRSQASNQVVSVP